MTAKPRKMISHVIIKAIRDREGREVFNDDLAKTLKLTREQVRNSVRQMMRDHPEYGIIETSPYYYVHSADAAVAAGAKPVSAMPHIPTYDELADATQAALGGDPAQTHTVNASYARTMDQIFAEDRAANPGKYPLTPGEYDVVPRRAPSPPTHGIREFSVVKRSGDVVILVDEHDALWAAKKL